MLPLNFLQVLRVGRNPFRSPYDAPPVREVQAQKFFVATTHWSNEVVLRSYCSKAVEA